MNEVHLQGRVMRTWRFRGDLLARVSVPRDPDRPQKNGTNFDYVTVRFPGGWDKRIGVTDGMDIRVHGFIQSRDYEERLSDFLKDAEPKIEVDVPDGREPRAKRATTEVVVERFTILNGRR